MNVVFWGTPEYSVPSLKAIVNNGYNVIGIVTQPDKRRTRGNKFSYSPVKKIGIDLSIPVFTPTRIRDESEVRSKILELEADIYIVVAFGQILPIEVLNRPKLGCWNAHASLLPKWRGAAPIQRSIINGDKETGVNIIYMEEGLDTGPILLEKKIQINITENSIQLSKRLSEISAELLVDTISLIQEQYKRLGVFDTQRLDLSKQSNVSDNSSYAKIIDKKEYLINWNQKSYDISNKVRGLYPNAYTTISGKRVKVLCTKSLESIRYNDQVHYNSLKSISYNSNNLEPGLIIDRHHQHGITVLTGDSPIIIREAQIEGKKPTSGNKLVQQLGTIESLKFE
ncbi:methionyl-tRNA formyltransferase [Prochlorococcus sp. MIT 1223]|uniref:methionyl-tRNA formyltransferase n=1 Tax=Prochlorococcus sp. MIT 1223 TaxID=3096217 RepID=UPI002A748084|nr:methionyl-tRNA formyltransferase [Prochlorococcus sp. MIT 1223]